MATDRRRGRRTSGVTAAFAAVVAFGLLLRIVALITNQGGLTTHVHPGYDESVYISAAWLVRSGSLPYRDFVFVFPPGFLMLLLPVVQVASFFGGPALTVTLVRLLAACVGACNIWLVGRISCRWLGPVGGLVAAMLYATMPLVVLTDASALQEPFVNLAVLLAVALWAQRTDNAASTRRLVGAGLLIGVAISIKLVAGVVLVPFLIAGPFARPVADRVRLAFAAGLPLALTGAIFAGLVGWRPMFEQAIKAQVLRGRDGEGMSRVNTMLPVLRGQVGVVRFIGPSAWIAVIIFGIVCAAAIWKGGPPGRLWGAMGLTILGALMVSPSYYAHYGVLLAPALSLLTAWVITAAFRGVRRERGLLVRLTGTLLVVLVVAISATQTATALDGLPVGIADFGHHLGAVVHDDGPPDAGRLSQAIARVPSRDCIVAVRPQLLLDMDRVPSADRDGHVLLDVYGSALLAASRERRPPGKMPGAFAFPAVQATIVRQSHDCPRIVFAQRICEQGRKDISARTQAEIESGTKLVANVGCLQLRKRGPSRGGTSPP